MCWKLTENPSRPLATLRKAQYNTLMNDKKLAARINQEVERLLAETKWLQGVRPAPFYFETKCVDLEIALTAVEPHAAFHNIHIFCKSCGYTVYYSDEELGCINGNCARRWSRQDINTMSAAAISKAFRTMEDTSKDDSVWPDTLHDVVQERKKITVMEPMTKEEFTRARVERFYAARQSFRKDNPCR
jgi:hypothetical protein